MKMYKCLFRLDSDLYAKGSPVLIEQGALSKNTSNNKLIVQIKFKNISDKVITGLSIHLKVWNENGEEIDETDYIYDDINAERFEEFGQKVPIFLSNPDSKKYKVACTKVSFSDETVWKNRKNAKWTPLPKEEKLDFSEELLEQYITDTSESSEYAPIQFIDIWRCSCGTICRDTEENCINCNVSKQAIFDSFNAEVLAKQIDDKKPPVLSEEKEEIPEQLKLEFEQEPEVESEPEKEIEEEKASVVIETREISEVYIEKTVKTEKKASESDSKIIRKIKKIIKDIIEFEDAEFYY